MTEVTLTIGERRHVVACRDGEQDALHRVGAMLDAHWPAARRAAGGQGAERTMLFVALMLADALDEAVRLPEDAAPRPDPAVPDPALPDPALLDRLADRLEALADGLEH